MQFSPWHAAASLDRHENLAKLVTPLISRLLETRWIAVTSLWSLEEELKTQESHTKRAPLANTASPEHRHVHRQIYRHEGRHVYRHVHMHMYRHVYRHVQRNASKPSCSPPKRYLKARLCLKSQFVQARFDPGLIKIAEPRLVAALLMYLQCVHADLESLEPKMLRAPPPAPAAPERT